MRRRALRKKYFSLGKLLALCLGAVGFVLGAVGLALAESEESSWAPLIYALPGIGVMLLGSWLLNQARHTNRARCWQTDTPGIAGSAIGANSDAAD